MSAPSIVNALVAWATGDDARIEELKSNRDALVAVILGKKPLTTLTSASLNGKTFQGIATLTVTEKLELMQNVLERLGESDGRPTVTFGAFGNLQR